MLTEYCSKLDDTNYFVPGNIVVPGKKEPRPSRSYQSCLDDQRHIVASVQGLQDLAC